MRGICAFHEKIKGFILFEQNYRNEPVKITLKLSGFKKKKKYKDYAIHIHEFGDLREGCTSTGGHFNPFNAIHGLIYKEHHVGDIISNITPNEKGNVSIQWKDNKLSLFPLEKTNIIGRSIVIHEYPDDLGNWTIYKKMTDKELLDFCLERNYIKKKKDFNRQKMEEYCIEQSKITGNAGGRMTCAIIGICGEK